MWTERRIKTLIKSVGNEEAQPRVTGGNLVLEDLEVVGVDQVWQKSERIGVEDALNRVFLEFFEVQVKVLKVSVHFYISGRLLDILERLALRLRVFRQAPAVKHPHRVRVEQWRTLKPCHLRQGELFPGVAESLVHFRSFYVFF